MAGTNSWATEEPILHDCQLGAVTSGTANVGDITISHHADSGARTITEFYAGFFVVRIGEI